MKLLNAVYLLFVFLISPSMAETHLPPQEDPYLAFAEEMPTPIGGLEAIFKKIVYPDIAKKAGLEGKVYMLVLINENGTADDVKVIKGIGGGCEEAAAKALKEAKYTPGKNKGVPVKVKLSFSIPFKLK